MAGIQKAGTTETDPDTPAPLLVLVSCPVDNRPDGAPRLSGKMKIKVKADSLAGSIYGKTEIEEAFHCNYELNRAYREKLEKAGLKVSGEMADGGVRIVELTDRPFYIGTGFVPQLSSEAKKPHPLIMAYLEAALK
ncbi:MAG: hypothetical protein ABR886_07575 [Dehalococcoidales bacterium]